MGNLTTPEVKVMDSEELKAAAIMAGISLVVQLASPFVPGGKSVGLREDPEPQPAKPLSSRLLGRK